MRWLNNSVATGAYQEVFAQYGADTSFHILDVRNLVDKSGNNIHEIQLKIKEGVNALSANKKLIVCCDYGMSRSNAIAIGIISKTTSISFSEAVEVARQKIDETGLKIEVLNTVLNAINTSTNDNKVNINKKIWITGAHGFIGKSITSIFTDETQIFTTSSSKINLLSDTLKADLFIKENEISHVIHLATPKIYTTNRSLGDTLLMLKNVLDICRSNNLHLIFLSTWEVYSGYQSSGLLVNENTPLLPKGTYGETKWLCEKLIQSYIANYNLPCTIIRSSPVIGIGSDKPKFIYNFIQKALLNEPIWAHLYKNGSPALDLISITDLAEAIKLLIINNCIGAYNVGSGKLVTTKEVAETICLLTNSSSQIHYTTINDFAANIHMDFSKISKMGWQPCISYAQELTNMIHNYNIKL